MEAVVKSEMAYKTKHQIFNFDAAQRVNSENSHYFGVYTAARGFTHFWCYKITFLMLKNVAHKKNNKKREAALKNEAGGDEKHLFFLLGLIVTVKECCKKRCTEYLHRTDKIKKL